MTKKNTELINIDFKNLILGLSSAAISSLNQSDEAKTKTKTANLHMAYQNIEIIKLLKEKTKGNLTAEEEQLTNDVINNLQQKFSKKCDLNFQSPKKHNA